jgi:hypothetical protein
MNVFLCDDQQQRVDDAVEEIDEAAIDDLNVTVLVGDKLTTQLRGVFERVAAAIKSPDTYAHSHDLELDQADIILIDNNLANLSFGGARLTAEAVVGFLRVFTGCGYIVSLNKNPDVDFDLRYLIGDYDTRADLALNTEHLGNRALWTRSVADAEKGFLPWYWPALLGVKAQRESQIEFCLQRLDSSILSSWAFVPMKIFSVQ